jgi:hypothetical protein
MKDVRPTRISSWPNNDGISNDLWPIRDIRPRVDKLPKA